MCHMVYTITRSEDKHIKDKAIALSFICLSSDLVSHISIN